MSEWSIDDIIHDIFKENQICYKQNEKLKGTNFIKTNLCVTIHHNLFLFLKLCLTSIDKFFHCFLLIQNSLTLLI